MCNHAYTTDTGSQPRSMGDRCPYPKIYEKSRAASTDAAALPVDESGACIFHSHDASWKRRNDFKLEFLRVVQSLNEDDTLQCCDFREFVFVGDEPSAPRLLIEDTEFRKPAYFTGAFFVDSVELSDVFFHESATFRSATFAGDVRMNNVRFRGLDFSNATLARLALFINVEFLSYTFFEETRFTGNTAGYVVKFEDSRFQGITDFSGSAFILGGESTVGFVRTQFEDFTNFGNTQFRSQVVFNEVSITSDTELIDTSFATDSSARYRGAAVEFNRIEVTKGASLTFRSTDPQNKMFSQDAQFSFKEELAGIIRFENVNFNKILPASRNRLTQLAKSGTVEIGAGCIKYRFQTDLRTVTVSNDNAPLVLELCQTFTNYFTVSNGFNLGFEIVERDESKVSFFYFTDEDITEDTFLARLARTEQNLWNLLWFRSDEQILALEASPETAPQPVAKEHAVINAVDGISALLGTFFRVGMRIALGTWKETDTKSLLGAIQFNKEGAKHRALSLHRVIADKYTARTLFGINLQQNRLLPPMVMDSRYLPSPGKTRILFLGANSSSSPLALGKEAKQIQTNLKLAKERDKLELCQEWAVTVESMIQAMLDSSPTIVHFSGHGRKSGILLQDEAGEPKVVPTAALSSMFKLFKESVRCVVLSSCYSEHQARAIRKHIPHVIGMSSRLSDSAALAFSTGFYKAIGAGRDISFAFELGKTAIQLEDIPDEDAPVLL